MRTVSSLPIVMSVLFALAPGCPKPLPAEETWVPVEGAPATRSLFTDEQKAVAEKFKMQAHINKMRAAFPQDDERSCQKDADCVLTPMHCCTCAAGGQTEAVRADKLPDLLLRRGKACEEYACAQVVSSHPSCDATRARCDDGRCVPDIPQGAGAGAVPTEPIEPESDDDDGSATQ